jgi:hypothetical protein
MSRNADPVGTQGQKPQTDIDIAMLGGDDFTARLASLAVAKEEAAKALQRLKLGTDIVAMRDDAQRKLQVAEDTKAAADSYAARVRKEADDYFAATTKDIDDHSTRRRRALKAACDAAEEAKQNAVDDHAAAKSARAAAKQSAAEAADLKQLYERKVAKLKAGLADALAL